jgi:hypothetical protein
MAVFNVTPTDTTFNVVSEAATEAAKNAAAAAADRAEVAAATVGKTVTIGRPSISSSATNAALAGVYVFASVAAVSSEIRTMRVRSGRGVPFDIEVAAYTREVNGQLTRVGSPVTVTVPPSATSTVTMPSLLKVRRGQLLGFSVPGSGNTGMAFVITAGDGAGYYYHDAPGEVGPFTPSSGINPQTSIQLQIGFDGFYTESYPDIINEVLPTVEANTAAAALNAAAISGLSQSVSVVGFAQTRGDGYLAFLTGAPSSKAWAVGMLGTALAAGSVIPGAAITVHRGTGIETFEAMLYSRDIASNAVPSGAVDTELWPAWVSVSAAGIASGTFGRVVFNAPNLVTVDATKSYLLVVRARNASNTIVDMGVGRQSEVDSGLSQLQRGFFRNSADTAWSSIGTTNALNIEILIQRQTIRQEVLPPTLPATAAPRRGRGTLVMMGRTGLVFSNATPKTFRRIFSVPANVARVVRVMFAHGGTTPITIAGAAIAPIASTANYAASGVQWTALEFPGGASANIPGAPAAGRLGWLASTEKPVTLFNRTDTPGAAKLVVVDAFCSTAANLTLLGAPDDSDDYRTNWQSRADFPMVMRRNDGDCVTTPANFVSTTNEKSGTFIAGLVVECDSGELLTIGAVGDSITNGAGVSPATTYGLGWVETMAYALNTSVRGVLPVMLGWSGASMVNIGNSATDYYAFLRAQGIAAPNILFAPNASPNSMPVPLADANVTSQMPIAEGIAATALGVGSIPVIWTVIPINPSVRNWGANDIFRRNYNDTWRARGNALGGWIVADMDAVMSGTIDGNGQMNLAPSLTTDNIHPNEAGHSAMRGVAIAATRSALPSLGYAVGGLVT